MKRHTARCRFRPHEVPSQAQTAPQSSLPSGQPSNEDILPDLHNGSEDVASFEQPGTAENPALEERAAMSYASNENDVAEDELALSDATFNVVDHLVAMAAKTSDRLVNDLIKALNSPNFDAAQFRDIAPNVSECRKVLEHTSKDALKDLGFKKHFIEDGSAHSDKLGVLHLKDVIGVLQKQVSLAGPEDFILRPSNGAETTTFPSEFVGHAVNRPILTELYNSVKKAVMESQYHDIFWNEESPYTAKSCVGFLQIYTDKTVTTLKANALVAYPIHIVFANATVKFRRFLIDNGHTIVGFLPVEFRTFVDSWFDIDKMDVVDELEVVNNTHVPVEDFVPHTSSSRGRVAKLETLHKVMLLIFKPLLNARLKGFEAFFGNVDRWNIFPILVSYCCDIPECKDMSAVKHGLSCQMPCVRCMIPSDQFSQLTTYPTRDMSQTMSIRREVKDLINSLNTMRQGPRRRAVLEAAAEKLDAASLSPVPSFLEELYCVGNIVPNDAYSIFTFEPLHNLHLGISKLLKTCTIQLLSSDDLYTHPTKNSRQQRKFSSIKNKVLRSCNALLAAIEAQFPIPGVHVDYSKKESSVQLNGFFTHDGIKGMLEAKNYQNMDMIFPFIAAFIDRATGLEDTAMLTHVHATYSLLMNTLSGKQNGSFTDPEIEEIDEMVKNFKRDVVTLFEPHCDSGLFTLKFHLLDHLCTDLRCFGTLAMLDAGPYEHFNHIIKMAYRKTSMRIKTRMDETVDRLEPALKQLRRTNDMRQGFSSRTSRREDELRQSGVYLVESGIQISLFNIRRILDGDSTATHEMQSYYKHFKDTYNVLGNDALRMFVTLLTERCRNVDIHFSEPGTILTLVKSGYIVGGFTPSLKDVDVLNNFISTEGQTNSPLIRQRVFATHEFGPNKVPMYSYVLIRGESGGKEGIWVAKVLLLFHMTFAGVKEQCAFIQYMECTTPLDDVDRRLDCVCLRWATSDEQDLTTLGGPSARTSTIEGGEWYDIVQFQTLEGVVHVIRSNFAVQQFTKELPWPFHRFYVNKFYRDSAAMEYEDSAHGN